MGSRSIIPTAKPEPGRIPFYYLIKPPFNAGDTSDPIVAHNFPSAEGGKIERVAWRRRTIFLPIRGR